MGKIILKLGLALLTGSIASSIAVCDSSSATLRNSQLTVQFGKRGITSFEDRSLQKTFAILNDSFSITIDGREVRSEALRDPAPKSEAASVRYLFEAAPYRIEVVYDLRPGWRFVSKRLLVTAPTSTRGFQVNQIKLLDIRLSDASGSVYVANSRWVKPHTPNRSYAIFERFRDRSGLFALVQNPFLTISHDPSVFSVSYSPEIAWSPAYGPFKSDLAAMGTYQLSGYGVPERAVAEWEWQPESDRAEQADEDEAEISTFMDCVRAFLLDAHPKPVAIDVGWTENDYQIDIATPGGRAEYKRIIDRTASLGIPCLLFGPSNTDISAVKDDADSWHWEHVLWLGLGQKIRQGRWNVETGTIPESVQEMLDYAKSKNVKLVAYVYPTLPFSANQSWLVGDHKQNANLASRALQDWLIKQLLTFYRRTGIGGYSFDYTWLNLPGASAYSEWWGWRRILEALRAAEPNMVIDGRQQYQMYSPWVWLAGSYPHPTSTDEQPESFTPFPDLHFDRVSADRERYTAYLYRIDDFCPPELMPGFIGHQTPRNDDAGKLVNAPFRRRDWDYLGWPYSLISSIAVAGLNNVVNMLPARDPAENRFFSQGDIEFFRHWLDWTDRHRAYLLNTRFILGQPQFGKLDGTTAFIGNHGYVFLFNPNARKLDARLKLDQSIGLAGSGSLLVRELYPQEGRLWGKPNAGWWSYGDQMWVHMDGASAIVWEVGPLPGKLAGPLLFNVSGSASLQGGQLTLSGVKGEAGTTRDVEVLLPSGVRIVTVAANGRPAQFHQDDRLLTLQLHFQGEPFSHMQQVGSFDPKFAGGTFKGTFSVPEWVFDQLGARQRAWPIPWTEEDLKTTWLAPQRLLLFVQIAEPNDGMSVHLTMDGAPVALQKAYSSVRPNPESFVGFYADVSNLHAGHEYKIELELPTLRPGQFQGLFFDNVQPGFTEKVQP